ncbi:rhombosortase [Paraglaciecola sp.]|uniref:rhombosortase n=2 Tax=Paraglaciecola sp. TaxID=1920173 RepID=UPI003299B028
MAEVFYSRIKMLNLPLQKQYVIGPIVIIALSILMAITEPSSSTLFAYEYEEISRGDWWRLISGHFLHTNTNHMLLNLFGIALLWALHGHYTTTSRYLALFIFLCLSTSISLYMFAPQLKWYVGLSGVLHGLFVVGAYYDIKHHFKTGWVMLVGIAVKVLNEQMYGASGEVAKLIDANVAIDAHLFGSLSGLLVILLLFGKHKLTTPKTT